MVILHSFSYCTRLYCVHHGVHSTVYESSHLGRAWYVGELAECVSRSRHVRRGDVNSNTQVMHVPYMFGLIFDIPGEHAGEG